MLVWECNAPIIVSVQVNAAAMGGWAQMILVFFNSMLNDGLSMLIFETLFVAQLASTMVIKGPTGVSGRRRVMSWYIRHNQPRCLFNTQQVTVEG